MNITDVGYRISWDGGDRYRPEFQITFVMPDGREEEIGYTPEMTCRDQEEAQLFAEGFALELLGG